MTAAGQRAGARQDAAGRPPSTGTSTGATGADRPDSDPDGLHRNEIVLAGRLAAPAEARVLPSGDTISTWRLVVSRGERADPGARAARRASVDTVDCVAWPAALQRRAARWCSGDVIEVTGALRRRFWRAAAAPASRCEVEVATVRRLSRARDKGAG